MRRKLHTIWWMVLLRGLIEGLLAAPFFVAALRVPEHLTLAVPALMLGGGLVELAMFVWLREHPFRNILRLLALGSVALGLYLLWSHPETTVGMLVVLTGLWMVLRGFAALWLGLSIVRHPYIRAASVVGGLGAAGFGATAMLFLAPSVSTFALFLLLYATAGGVMHIIIALRMRADKRRVLAEERAASV